MDKANEIYGVYVLHRKTALPIFQYEFEKPSTGASPDDNKYGDQKSQVIMGFLSAIQSFIDNIDQLEPYKVERLDLARKKIFLTQGRYIVGSVLCNYEKKSLKKALINFVREFELTFEFFLEDDHFKPEETSVYQRGDTLIERFFSKLKTL